MEESPESVGQGSRQSFRSEDRVRARSEYRRVQKSGTPVHTKSFLILVAASPHPRVGVTVTKKIGNAVERNRVKRLVRELFRLNRDLFPNADCVFIAKRTIRVSELSYSLLVAELQRAKRALSSAASEGKTS